MKFAHPANNTHTSAVFARKEGRKGGGKEGRKDGRTDGRTEGRKEGKRTYFLSDVRREAPYWC